MVFLTREHGTFQVAGQKVNTVCMCSKVDHCAYPVPEVYLQAFLADE